MSEVPLYSLSGMVDITCDLGGAFEMLTHSTFPEVLRPSSSSSSVVHTGVPRS